MSFTDSKEWETRNRVILFAIPFLIGVLLRIYPYLLYHVPYSTDSWQPIKDTEALLANSPTQLGGNQVFDTYNIYWPANSIFGAAASLLLNVPPIVVMPIMFPIVTSVTLLLFFLIAEKLTRSTLAASIATLLFSTAGFYAIFTAAVTKEGFANPLYMLCLYLLLLRRNDLTTMTIFALSSFVLVLSHHATTFIFLGLAVAISFTDFILSKRRGESVGARPLFIPGITALILVSYFLLYANAGLGILSSLLNLQEFLVLLSFCVVMIFPAIYHTIGPSRKKFPVEESVVMAGVIVILLVSTRTNIIPLEPLLSSQLLLFALPYVIVGFFAIFGYRMLQNENRRSFGFLATWFALILAFEGFAGFGTGSLGGLGMVYRLFDFLYPPTAILASIGIYKGLRLGHGKFSIIVKPMLVVLVIAICASTAYQTYAASVQESNLLGGHWVYHESDLSSAYWIRNATKTSGNFAISVDSRENFLLSGYLGVNLTSIQRGYEYLAGISNQKPQYLVTYALMERNGYVLDPYALSLPNSWLGNLESNSSLIYSNGNDMLWR